MKTKLKILGGFCALALCVSAFAALPTYKTISASGTSSATGIFPHDPNSQIRITTAVVSSDLATSKLSFYTGTTAHYLTATNASGATSIQVESTNGIASSALLYLSVPGVSNFVVTVSGFTSPTNVTVSACGAACPVGTEVEVLSAASPVFTTGAITNKIISGEALFVGNYGRAVYVTQTGTSYSSLDAVSAHYDAQSQ